MAHVKIPIFKDKSIKNSRSMIHGDQEALGYPQRPQQAQTRRKTEKVTLPCSNKSTCYFFVGKKKFHSSPNLRI